MSVHEHNLYATVKFWDFTYWYLAFTFWKAITLNLLCKTMPWRADSVNSIPLTQNLSLVALLSCCIEPSIQFVLGATLPGTEFLASLFAGKHLRPLTACVAFDEAAPLELAITLPHFGVLMCIITSPTTHKVTAIGVWRSAIAKASLGAHTPCGCVLLAVVWWPFNVDKVCLHGLAVALSLLYLKVGGLAQSASPNYLHMHSFVVLVLEYVANFTELGKCSPTGLSGAGAWDTMALAFQLHPFF